MVATGIKKQKISLNKYSLLWMILKNWFCFCKYGEKTMAGSWLIHLSVKHQACGRVLANVQEIKE